ncbi:hypothetical protein [Heyndrickxia acidicola]|uniref:DUF2188 domain-containing protein n=1 Tax=Heyndrickxia acidicola TaxID=209389 RepID=A0ABU6MGR4_9BACI|nr:hypothetical protein [Heyndrickxia acidicola]MED1202230.1 hypothetical protein [Heyndrickxia acidicola]
MFHLYIVEEIKPGDWRITTGTPSPGKISVQSYATETEARKALHEKSYSFE